MKINPFLMLDAEDSEGHCQEKFWMLLEDDLGWKSFTPLKSTVPETTAQLIGYCYRHEKKPILFYGKLGTRIN